MRLLKSQIISYRYLHTSFHLQSSCLFTNGAATPTTAFSADQ